MNVNFKVYWNNPIEMVTEAGTQQLTFEVPLGAIISNPSGATHSYPSFIGNADKVLTVNSTEDDVEWTTPLTQTYVDTQDWLIIDSLALKADTNYVDTQDSLLQDQIDLKADAMAVNQSLALKADLINGLIPASQLPSYVDDVLSFPDLVSFPSTGEDGKIYIAVDVNKTYRWGGSSYVEIGGGGVALGETSSTAYRGDRGKIAYDHSLSQGNPHNTTTTNINEGAKLFFTESRVNQTVLTGLNTNTATPALATDNLLAAIGKLQAQINNSNSSGFNWINANAISGYVASSGVTAHSTNPLKFAIKDGLLWVSGAIKITQANANAPFLSLNNPNYRLKVASASDVGYITVTRIADGDFFNITQIPVRIVSNNIGGQQGIWLYAQANITPQSYGNTLIFQPSAIGELLN